MPRVDQIAAEGASLFSALDWRVVAFTFARRSLTGVLFGLSLQSRCHAADLNSTLKEASGRSGSGLRHNRMRNVLVVVETALAMILLIGSALLIRTFVQFGP